MRLFSLANDFCTRIYDCTDDHHTQILPTRENCYRIVKAVVLRWRVKMSPLKYIDVISGVEKQTREIVHLSFYIHQCQYCCRRLFRDFISVRLSASYWNHSKTYKVRLRDHVRRGPSDRTRYLYTPLGANYAKEKREMMPERLESLSGGYCHNQPNQASMSAQPTLHARYHAWLEARRKKPGKTGKKNKKE